MGAGDGAVYLGEASSERTIKVLSADGTLARARIVHFATHGLLAGETELLAAANAEPALILTPPQTASAEDDGLLTASEIAQLRLDADWVVLSACNTAAGESDKPGSEALSGLARAFFYAGARALLVSHWAVNSEATVKLITKAFEEIAKNNKTGRAEALRRSMLALSASPGRDAHPGSWAPFVVVGEGAR
jgi:CHAT domain-containing protein